jgi:hypothetical protein
MLFKRNPGILHQVDKMLDQYVGRERELYAMLERQASSNTNSSNSGIAGSRNSSGSNLSSAPSTPLSKTNNSPRLSAKYSNEEILKPGKLALKIYLSLFLMNALRNIGMTHNDVEHIRNHMYRARQSAQTQLPDFGSASRGDPRL